MEQKHKKHENDPKETIFFLVNNTVVLVPYASKFLHTPIASINFLFSCSFPIQKLND